MTKNSIGAFLAALRKANGMTQQEVADRLNVSNKAVSRWERDECAPDLFLIPALAEMFGVTCDELLRGTRIPEASAGGKGEAKTEKQRACLLTRALSGCKIMAGISLAVSAIGLICMFGISYGFYRPVIGFAVMLLFEVCAFAIAALAVSRTKDTVTGNELFEQAKPEQQADFHRVFGNLSFAAFFVILAVLLLSLPLVLFSSDYTAGVLSFRSYLTGFFGFIVLLLVVVCLKSKAPFLARLTGVSAPAAVEIPYPTVRKRMALLQAGLTVLAAILFALAPYADRHISETPPLYTAMVLLGLGCLLGNIVSFIVFLIRSKSCRRQLILPGVRGLLFIPSALNIAQMHSVSWSYYGARSDHWYMEYFWQSVAVAVTVYLVFALIEALFQKKKTS